MIARTLVLILLLMACGAGGATAQAASISLRPGPSLLLRERPSTSQARHLREPLGGLLGPGDEDHRYPGFLVAASLGLVLTTVGLALCNDSDNGCDASHVLPLGVLMTGVLGLSGAVVGGFLPK